MSIAKVRMGGRRFQAQKRYLLLCSATFCVLSALSGTAMAQSGQPQSADSENDKDAIVVTARRVSETLQDVPVTVTVINSKSINDYQLNEVADIATRVPGLNVQVGGSGAGGQITLRGIGSTNISAAFDSAVAFNFDGVLLSTQRLVQAAFFDVQQIEVLKGPQSLYFGKSASAGALSITSANPTKTWQAGGSAAYEFEERGYTVGGYVSGPLTDTIGIRVAGQYQDIKRYVELDAGVPSIFADTGKGLRNTIARLTLQFDDPAERFSANLKVTYNHNDSDTLLGHSDVNCGADGVAGPTALFGGAVLLPSSATCNINDKFYPTGDANPALITAFPGTTGADRYRGQSYNETKTVFVRLAMDLNLTDSLKLSTISGFVDLKNEHADSFDSSARIVVPGAILPGGLGAPFSDALTQFSQEVRLSSNFKGPLNFQLGAFWETRNIPLAASQNALGVSLLFGPSVGSGSTFDWYGERNTKTSALSFFASGSFDITEKLELSGGVRWTDEEKRATIAFPYVHSILAFLPPFSIPSGFFAGPIVFKDDNLSPEATLRYKVSDDFNIYASYKTGFKSGGIDNSALPTGSLAGLNSADPAIVRATEDGLKFESETSRGFELGFKAQLADKTITINAVAYRYLFTNLQVQVLDVVAIQFTTLNAGQLRNQGVEVDWSWQSPLKNFNLFGSVGYLDTKVTGDFFFEGVNLIGTRGARAPKWSGNIGFDYGALVGSNMRVGLGGNMFFTSSYLTGFGPALANRQSAYQSFDGRVSIGHPEGKWKLSLIGVNLTDKIWGNTSNGRPFQLPGGDDFVVSQNRGRQISVEASFKF